MVGKRILQNINYQRIFSITLPPLPLGIRNLVGSLQLSSFPIHMKQNISKVITFHGQNYFC